MKSAPKPVRVAYALAPIANNLFHHACPWWLVALRQMATEIDRTPALVSVISNAMNRSDDDILPGVGVVHGVKRQPALISQTTRSGSPTSQKVRHRETRPENRFARNFMAPSSYATFVPFLTNRSCRLKSIVSGKALDGADRSCSRSQGAFSEIRDCLIGGIKIALTFMSTWPNLRRAGRRRNLRLGERVLTPIWHQYRLVQRHLPSR